MVTFHLSRVEKRHLFFQPIFCHFPKPMFGDFKPLFCIQKWSKIKQKTSHSRKSRSLKIWCFNCMEAWFWRVRASQIHQKSQKHKSRGQAEKNCDFDTSFLLLWGSSGNPIWALWEPSFLLKKGWVRRTPALLEEILTVFVVFWVSLTVLEPSWDHFSWKIYHYTSVDPKPRLISIDAWDLWIQAWD